MEYALEGFVVGTAISFVDFNKGGYPVAITVEMTREYLHLLAAQKGREQVKYQSNDEHGDHRESAGKACDDGGMGISDGNKALSCSGLILGQYPKAQSRPN